MEASRLISTPRVSLRGPHAAARSLLVGALAQIAELERTR